MAGCTDCAVGIDEANDLRFRRVLWIALGANAVMFVVEAVAALLFSHRGGDSNKKSIWLCSRNDAIANLAVIAAAGGVLATGSRWPDLAVAAGIAALNLSAALHVTRLASSELRTGIVWVQQRHVPPSTSVCADDPRSGDVTRHQHVEAY